MVGYIQQIAQDLAKLRIDDAGDVFTLLRALGEEIDRLDPRDFVPEGQYRFVRLRMRTRHWARQSTFTDADYPKFAALGKEASDVLDLFAGDGSRAVVRSFVFVRDPQLRALIERDYRELSLFLFPSQAWKSTVVMAGSVLEAILYDLLTQDAATSAEAIAALVAPKKRNLSKGEWRLHDLIQVALELGLLPIDRANAIDQILRDYRNFVHPLKEVRAAHPCSEAEALLAKGALDSICNHLQ